MKTIPEDWPSTVDAVFDFMDDHRKKYVLPCPACHYDMPMYISVYDLDEKIMTADWTWCTHCGTVFTYWP